jgi:hypothetical protein
MWTRSIAGAAAVLVFVGALKMDFDFDQPHSEKDLYWPEDASPRCEVGASGTTLTASIRFPETPAIQIRRS